MTKGKCERIHQAFIGVAIAIVVASGCSSPDAEAEGTNTNWVTCETTADCEELGADAVCRAGKCQRPPRPDAASQGTGGGGPNDPDAGSRDAAIRDAVIRVDAGPRADASGELPACEWPETLHDLDASSSRDACRAARRLLSCDLGGATQICLTSAPVCSDYAGGPQGCEDNCAPNEYAVACGGVGPGPIPDPPEGCSSSMPTPAGVVFHCCPCQ